MNLKPIICAALTMLATWTIGSAETSQVKLPKIDASIGQYAYLRDKLPEGTIAYIRVSHPMIRFFSAKNRTNDEALQHKGSVNALKEFRAVLGNENQLTTQLQKLGLKFSEENLKIINYTSEMLYQHLNGPIETVVLSESQTFSLMAKGLVVIPVNVQSVDELNTILAKNPLNKQLLQLDDNGYGTLEIGTFYFSPKERRLFIALGLEPTSLEMMQQRLANLKMQKQHPMYAFENQIDLTGQSNFIWVDLRNKENLLPMAQDSPAGYSILKLIDGVAVGDGTNDAAQGQLKLVVKTDSEQLLGLDSKLKNDFSFKTVGAPRGAVILPIPSLSMIQKMLETATLAAIEDPFVTEMSSEEKAEIVEKLYQDFQAEWVKHLGFDFTDILAFLGPNMTIYYDDLGFHSVVSIHNKRAFYDWLTQKDQEGILTYRQHRKTHHVILQNPLLKLLQKEHLTNPEHAGLAIAYPYINEYAANIYGVRALDLNWHFYWSDEGDYIRLSALPQIVEEENKLGSERFDRWLSKKQGINSDHVLFAATIDWPNADRRWYYNYLQFLQNSADILGTSFDITKMPRADQLSFADSSRLGIQMTADREYLTFSLDYGSDNNSGFLSSILFPSMIAPFMGAIESTSSNREVEELESDINLDSDLDIEAEIEVDMNSDLNKKSVIN